MISEHLHTGSGMDIHHRVSLQEADFRVDTFHYNALSNTLNNQIHIKISEYSGEMDTL